MEISELDTERMTYTVFNALGQEIVAGNIVEPKTTLYLAKGFYFVRVKSKAGNSVQKVVVE